MKLEKKIARLVLCSLMISLFTVIACADRDMTTITGTVEQTDVGLVIKAGDADYAASGADLAALVGKTIEATGKVTENDAGKVINVVAIKEVKE